MSSILKSNSSKPIKPFKTITYKPRVVSNIIHIQSNEGNSIYKYSILLYYITMIIMYGIYKQYYQLIIVRVKIMISKTKFHSTQLLTNMCKHPPYLTK